YGFDDALYTAARIMDLLARSEQDLDSLLATLPADVGTPEINLTVTDEGKFDIVQRLSDQGWFEGGELSTIDGVRVDYADGFGLVRASNTTPVLVLRFEAADDAALARILHQFKTQLALVEPSLSLDF
ncbi:MAG: phosphomannomutase/phosphoglucomutase, partial [Litorivicinus sp.]